MIGRLLELFEGPEAPASWSPPPVPASLHHLLPWRAWDEQSELYVNASSIGFVLELPPFVDIDEEVAGALAGTFADAAPERCTLQVLHWASPRFGATYDAWAAPRARAGGVQARIGKRRGALLQPAGWRKLHAGGPPNTLSDYRVFITACLAGPPGPAAETALGAFRRALEGTLASAGAWVRRLEPDALLTLVAELTAPDVRGTDDGGSARRPGAGRPAIPSTSSASPPAGRSRWRPRDSPSITRTARTWRSGCSPRSRIRTCGRVGGAMS